MKKHEFFSMVKEGGEPTAKKQSGYTDGEYNYYSAHKTWYCIEPKTGLAVAWASTRKEAQQQAQERAEKIEAYKKGELYRKTVEQFNELRQKAKNGALFGF